MVSAGEIEMGSSKKFSANSDSRVFDRETQNQLFQGVALKTWSIFYGRNNEHIAKSLTEKMKEASDKLRL